MRQKITHILFDLGNVLVELNGMPFLRKLFPNLTDLEVQGKWLSLKSVSDFECGRSSRRSFCVAATQEMKLELSPRQFGDLFASWMVGPFGGAVELVQSLTRDYRVGCLSNTSEIHISKLNDQSSLMGEFHDAYLSYEMGVLKPKAEAFEHVLSKWSVEAESILFLDDNEANIEAASALGFDAVQVFGLDAGKTVCSQLLNRT